MNAKKILAVLGFAVLLALGISGSKEASTKPEYYFYIYSSGSTHFFPGEEIPLHLNCQIRLNYPLSFTKKVALAVYALDEKALALQQEKEGMAYLKKQKPVKEWTEKVHFKPYSYEWHYEYHDIKITLDKPGYYLVYGKFGDKEYALPLNVTNISAITKSDDEKVVLFVQNLKDSKPVKNASVRVMNNENKDVLSGKTDAEGILEVFFSKLDKEYAGGELRFEISQGDSKTRVTAYPYSRAPETFKAYISTDRPVYRPEQKVYFKGVLRMEKEKELHALQNEDVDVLIKDTKGNEIYKEKLKSNVHGSVSGELMLTEEPALGDYSIAITAKGQSQVGTFKVEEYRKPEYEVNISSTKNTYAQDEKVAYDIAAKYYFGAPVAGAEYKYTIVRKNYYPYYSYYHYWWIEEDEPYYYGGYGETVADGQGKTDANGKAVVHYEPKKLDYDSTYTIYVQMTDSSRKEVSSSHSVKVTRARFFMSMTASKYYYKLDEEAIIKIHAQDYDGKPVKTDVSVEISHNLYDYKKGTITTPLTTEKLTTDENGNAILHYTPRKEGSYTLMAVSYDSGKNKITASAYFVASDSERISWVQATQMDIIPDKTFYEPGEEAKIVIQCPVKDAYALLTIEGDRVYEKHLLHFDAPVLLVPVKITQNLVPNFFVSITFIHNKTYYAKAKEIVAPATDKFLTVKLSSEKEKYEPRETAKYLIKTLNSKGNPESAEVALAVADESVFAIAEDKNPPIQKFFYGKRYNNVYTYNSIGGYSYYPEGTADMAMTGDAPMMEEKEFSKKGDMMMNGKGKDGDEGGYAPTITRTYFPDTAYYNPFIITDEKGEATVNVSLPDSLTTWRGKAIAATLDTKVGDAENKIIVTKKLLVRLELPRFANEKDAFTASAVVHNYLPSEKEVKVELKADGVKILSDASMKIKIAANGEKRVDWKVEPSLAGDSKAKLTVYALSDEASDAMELPLPILPHGTERYEAASGDTKTKSNVTLLMPDSANAQTASLRLILSPSIASMVFSSLEYLVGYPYGCVEQTMSRFLPNVIVAQALKKLGMKNEKIEKEMPEWVSKGLGRLYNFHHSDGGWGWWENDESHPYMTAYVIFGLTQAKNAGFKVDESKISAGVSWLKNRLESEKDLSTQVYMLYALSVAGKADKEQVNGLYGVRKKLNAYSMALVAIMLHDAGEKTKAKEILSILERAATQSATIAYWKGQSFSHGWTDNEVESTAYVLKAFLTVDNENAIVQKIIRYLSQSRRGNYWVSTKDTAAAIFAITQYLQYSGELNPNFKAKITVNGKLIKELAFTKDDVEKEGKEIKIPGSDLVTGKNALLFEKEGDGRLYYAAYLKYYSREENVPSANSGFKVKRKYDLITDEGPEAIRKTTKIKSGDRILVTLTITADTHGQYVLVEDPKPAGCEILEDVADLGVYGYEGDKKKVAPPSYGYWNYWFSHKEVRDDKMTYFATNFYSGTQTIAYILRAETPGTFHTMPARVSLMYAPEVGGAGSENVVVIKD